eukprot:10062634-Ditylum_brightwellii.AAC.1
MGGVLMTISMDVEQVGCIKGIPMLAVDLTEEQYMQQHVISQKEQFVVRKSVDEECVHGAQSQWVLCSKGCLNMLGKETKISEYLHLHSNCAVEMSNNKDGCWDQGQ